jgi:hypothetical protein
MRKCSNIVSVVLLLAFCLGGILAPVLHDAAHVMDEMAEHAGHGHTDGLAFEALSAPALHCHDCGVFLSGVDAPMPSPGVVLVIASTAWSLPAPPVCPARDGSSSRAPPALS